MIKPDSLYQLSHIIFPTIRYFDNCELFLRDRILEGYLHGKRTTLRELKFDTWMNLFAAKKYANYCNLGNLYLQLNIKGSYSLKIIGTCRNSAFSQINTILYEFEGNGDLTVKIPNAASFDAVYFALYEDIDHPVEFFSGSWNTDTPPIQQNQLAIVICTFHREDYVHYNATQFEHFLSQTPSLKNRIHLFIVDNGKTLNCTQNNEAISIYHNINAGGAGGFTRGLLEVLKQDKKYTRVLFMDDDVEVLPESYYRTLLLADYLKEEYKDSFINGAMLDLYNKKHFVENLAERDKLGIRSYFQDRNIDFLNEILCVNEIPASMFNPKSDKQVHSSWWYHCFPISCVKEKGLPLPVFFQGDDIEWSWRHQGKHHISINGINVWHTPFIWRVSKPTRFYYSVRNVFFANILYESNDFKKNFPIWLSNEFYYLLYTYDYTAAEIYLRAMEDILKGSSVFRTSPEIQLQEITAINKQTRYEECKNETLFEAAKNWRTTPGIPRKIKKAIYLLTGHGKFCPSFLMYTHAMGLDWFPPIENFILARDAAIYNPYTKKYTIRTFNRKKLFIYEKKFKSLLRKIQKNYSTLEKDFQTAKSEFITVEFWEKYLGL